MDRTATFYMRPSYEFHGSGFPIFSGSRRQRGGSIFGSIKKFFTPIAKSVGKNLLTQGIGLAQSVAADALAGKNIKDSFLSHGKTTAKRLGRSALTQGVGALSKMVGRGKRRRIKRRKRSTHKRRIVRKRSRSTTSRKRKRRAKSSTSKRSAKKRRVSFNF